MWRVTGKLLAPLPRYQGRHHCHCRCIHSHDRLLWAPPYPQSVCVYSQGDARDAGVWGGDRQAGEGPAPRGVRSKQGGKAAEFSGLPCATPVSEVPSRCSHTGLGCWPPLCVPHRPRRSLQLHPKQWDSSRCWSFGDPGVPITVTREAGNVPPHL